MAYILSMICEKGGSGKTTSCVNVASELAVAMKELSEDSKPVLIIDTDPAGGSTLDIGPEIKPEKYYADMIMEYCESGELPNIQDAIVPTGFKGLDIMPSSPRLGIATQTIQNQDIAREKILSTIFKELGDLYSWILIDTIGAKFNALTLNVMALSIPGSQLYIAIPIEPEQKNFASYVHTKALVDRIVNTGLNKTNIIAVFFTKVDERRSYDKIMLNKGEELFGKAYLPCPIHYAGAVVRAATENHMPINYVRPDSRIAKDYEKLCSGIVERILGGEYNG